MNTLGKIGESQPSLGLVLFWGAMLLVIFSIMVFTMLRFGLLAAMVSSCLLPILSSPPLTFDLGRWYAPGSLIILMMVIGLYVYGFFISLGGRRLFVDPFEN